MSRLGHDGADLAFDIGKHVGTEALRSIIDQIDQRATALDRLNLRDPMLIIALGYCQAFINHWRRDAVPLDAVMFDKIVAVIMEDRHEEEALADRQRTD